jgi:hypothetical protein
MTTQKKASIYNNNERINFSSRKGNKQSKKYIKNRARRTKKYIKNRARRNREKLKIQIGGNILTSLYESFIQWLKEIGIIERDDNERVARLKDLKQQMSKHPGQTIYGKSKNAEKTKMREKNADEYKLLEKKYSDISLIVKKAFDILDSNGTKNYDKTKYLAEFHQRNCGFEKKKYSHFDWHTDDGGATSYPVYSVLFYLRKDKTVSGGNLEYEINKTKFVHEVKQGDILSFRGDLKHYPQPTEGFGCRDIIVVFVKRT